MPYIWYHWAIMSQSVFVDMFGKLLHLSDIIVFSNNYTPRFNEVERGVYWYHLVCLSVCPSVDRIVSALYLQQYSSDPFHICTSYQATSEVLKFWNFGEFFKFVTLTLSSFDLLFLVSFLRCHCRLQFRMDSFHIWYKWSIAWEGVSHVMTFDLDLYLQGHSALT